MQGTLYLPVGFVSICCQRTCRIALPTLCCTLLPSKVLFTAPFETRRPRFTRPLPSLCVSRAGALDLAGVFGQRAGETIGLNSSGCEIEDVPAASAEIVLAASALVSDHDQGAASKLFVSSAHEEGNSVEETASGGMSVDGEAAVVLAEAVREQVIEPTPENSPNGGNASISTEIRGEVASEAAKARTDSSAAISTEEIADGGRQLSNGDVSGDEIARSIAGTGPATCARDPSEGARDSAEGASARDSGSLRGRAGAFLTRLWSQPSQVASESSNAERRGSSRGEGGGGAGGGGGAQSEEEQMAMALSLSLESQTSRSAPTSDQQVAGGNGALFDLFARAHAAVCHFALRLISECASRKELRSRLPTAASTAAVSLARACAGCG
eukprot:6174280-Pleurochrysis_carterae.AAC.1